MNQFWNTISQRIVAPTRLNGLQLMALLHPFGRSIHLRRHAGSVIVARVQLISLLFAVLVPLWSLVDLLVFPAATAGSMFMLRLASSAVFVALAWPREFSATAPYRQAATMLLLMLMVPPVFYLLSLQIIDLQHLDNTQRLVAQLYTLMPTVVLGGLAIFPLTALETLLFALPVLLTAIAGMLQGTAHFSLEQHGAALWFMVMMIGVAVFSGMSQCHYMATLVIKALHDPLTGAYTRQSGVEALDLMFRLAAMGNKPLTVIFLDIDHFKSVNDRYGHDAGDLALLALSNSVRRCLRRSDILIRWGGEEFVAVLPETPADSVMVLLQRLRREGLGQRPDGTPLTASIGVAENLADQVNDWPALVTLADQRMYLAKNQGRDCVVMPGNRREALI
ncbi:MAG: diguanylate cyclase [Bacteroidota bacterium]